MVIDHIGLKVKNIEFSASFYDAVLKPLECTRCYDDPEVVGYGPADQAMFWLHCAESDSSRTHIAFTAPDREAVAAVHLAGLANGGRDNGLPGLRPDYGPSYFAAFLFDPDGNNIEAVCNRENV